MVETAARRRPRGIACQTAPGADAPADPGPAGAAPGAVGVGSRSLRVPGRCLDDETGRGGHRAGVRGALSSRSCRTPAAAGGLVRPEADDAGDPTRRSGHHRLVRRAVAGGQKKLWRQTWLDCRSPPAVGYRPLQGGRPFMAKRKRYRDTTVYRVLEPW